MNCQCQQVHSRLVRIGCVAKAFDGTIVNVKVSIGFRAHADPHDNDNTDNDSEALSSYHPHHVKRDGIARRRQHARGLAAKVAAPASRRVAHVVGPQVVHEVHEAHLERASLGGQQVHVVRRQMRGLAPSRVRQQRGGGELHGTPAAGRAGGGEGAQARTTAASAARGGEGRVDGPS